MKKICVGIVGLGPIAQNGHLPAIEKARDIHLQAIADTDAALRDRCVCAIAPRQYTSTVTTFSLIRMSTS
jgi:predicted dehydrogenase